MTYWKRTWLRNIKLSKNKATIAKTSSPSKTKSSKISTSKKSKSPKNTKNSFKTSETTQKSQKWISKLLTQSWKRSKLSIRRREGSMTSSCKETRKDSCMPKICSRLVRWFIGVTGLKLIGKLLSGTRLYSKRSRRNRSRWHWQETRAMPANSSPRAKTQRRETPAKAVAQEPLKSTSTRESTNPFNLAEWKKTTSSRTTTSSEEWSLLRSPMKVVYRARLRSSKLKLTENRLQWILMLAIPNQSSQITHKSQIMEASCKEKLWILTRWEQLRHQQMK